jgi:AcrR family transcriptional regulator
VNINMQRSYLQTRRAQQTVEREERVLDEAERLFATQPFDRVTLQAVARAAGVTVPTLQRRFGNKEGLFHAWGQRLRERVAGQRGAPPVGDLRRCITELVQHYELEGRFVWHLLRQEDDIPLLKHGLDIGRGFHRQWVEQVFAHAIARRAPAERRALVDALVAATDLFVWKLLRLDLGRSRAELEAIMMATTQAIAGGR